MTGSGSDLQGTDNMASSTSAAVESAGNLCRPQGYFHSLRKNPLRNDADDPVHHSTTTIPPGFKRQDVVAAGHFFFQAHVRYDSTENSIIPRAASESFLIMLVSLRTVVF